MPTRQIVLLIIVLLLAAGLRTAMLPRGAADPLQWDEGQYDSVALHVATGHGYAMGHDDDHKPTARIGPSYVLLLAAMYRLAGHNIVVPLVFQVILEIFSCLLAFAIGRTVFRDSGVGVMAALLYAVYPPFIMHTAVLMTEIFANFAVLLSIYAFVDYRRSSKRSLLYLSAAAAGVGGLSKPILFLFPFIFLVIDYARVGRRRALADLVIQCVLIGLIVSPWVLRNAIVFHKFIPSVTGGFTFWGGTGPANGRVIGGLGSPHTPKYVAVAIEGMDEVERDEWYRRDGIRIIKEHPGRYAVLLLKKIPRLWFNLMHDDPPSKATMLLALYNGAILCFAGLGIRLRRPDRQYHRLLLLLVLYFTVVHMAFFSAVRYSMPVYAFTFCFAAAGILAAAGRLSRLLFAGKGKGRSSAAFIDT